MLDVSVPSQVVNLRMNLHEELGLTDLTIAHGLRVGSHVGARIA